MQRWPIRWHLFPSYLLVVVLSLGLGTWFASRSIRSFYISTKESNLEATAHLVAERLSHAPLDSAALAWVNPLTKDLGVLSKHRVTVILPDGYVIGDSHHDPVDMENHAGRPEIKTVMEHDHRGSSIRYSSTLDEEMMYVAVPLLDKENDLRAVVRTSLSTDAISGALNSLLGTIAVGGMGIVVFVALLGMWISRLISRPLEEMKRQAERFASGDLGRRLPSYRAEELAALSDSLNKMAAQLDERLRTVIGQRNEHTALFASISDGVIAVDANQKIININTAAAEMLGLDEDAVKGLTVAETIDNDSLRWFVSRSMDADGIEDEIILDQETDPRYLQATGTALLDAQGQRRGTVVVLNEVTRLRRLETARRDFVANVSHELRTPITSVKGFVETLRDGAIEDTEDARRFLEIIARQADRLENIVEDLLSLARIEREDSPEEMPLTETLIIDVLRSARQSCIKQADAKDITIEVVGDEHLTALVNAPLLEQAVTNLVDNAVKYSEPGTKVTVEVSVRLAILYIDIRDQGSGIETRHLPRIFERFYRVDKARSRQIGGTGLGLAIVKHIAKAHGGHVSVESTPGTGSTFTIYFPHRLPDEVALEEV